MKKLTEKIKSKTRLRNKQNGFTLLEVVIALGIMGTVMIVLTSSWRGNFRRVKKAKIQTQAVYLLQMKMTELEVFYKGRVRELPKESQSGKFKDKDFKNYSWQWQAQEFNMPDIARLFTTEEGIVDETTVNILKKMRKYMEDSIKEVKLTLFYQSSPKSKPIKYSISTIFVDYDIPLEIGLGGGL